MNLMGNVNKYLKRSIFCVFFFKLLMFRCFETKLSRYQSIREKFNANKWHKWRTRNENLCLRSWNNDCTIRTTSLRKWFWIGVYYQRWCIQSKWCWRAVVCVNHNIAIQPKRWHPRGHYRSVAVTKAKLYTPNSKHTSKIDHPTIGHTSRIRSKPNKRTQSRMSLL